MPRCPNCSYILVLIERRRKYKCAKCGKLFPQKEIEEKEFQKWNERQREDDKFIPKRRILTEYEKEQRRREYFEKNKDLIMQQRLDWVNKNRDKLREYQKKRYHKDIEYTRLIERIKYWRVRQKGLAENLFKV